MVKYLKLGDGAHTFHDPVTGVNLSNKQVIRLQNDLDLRKPSLAAALRTGHLIVTTREEWEASKKLHGDQAEESQKNLKIVTKTTTTTIGGNSSKEPSPHTPTVDVDEDGDDENPEDMDQDDDGDELTKSDLIDLIKEHGSLNKAEKKALLKKSEAELTELWNSIKPTD